MPDKSAMSDPNVEEAFAFLYAELREANRRFQAGGDAGRDGAIHALETVLKFLHKFQPVLNEALHAPLARLFIDLMALDDGSVSPLLKPKRRSGGAPASGLYDAEKGIAVFTVRRLVAAGVKHAAACTMVANRLVKEGVRPARRGSRGGSGQLGARTLRKWQEDIAADVGCHTIAAQTLREVEAGHLQEALAGMGLSVLPEGITLDSLLLSNFPAAALQRAHLDRLSQLIKNLRAAETT
jgi:hypothetical protein